MAPTHSDIRGWGSIPQIEVSAFLKKNFLLILSWPLLGLILAAFGWSLVLSGLERQERGIEQVALKKVQLLATHYAGQIARSVNVVDQMLRHARFEWMLSDGKLRLETVGKAGLFPPNQYWFVGVVDRKGRMLTTTLPIGQEVLSQVPILLRENFLAHTRNTTDFLYMSPASVIGPISGREVVEFSRKIINGKGEFDGVIALSVLSSKFTEDYSQSIFGEFGFLGVVGTNNTVYAARLGLTANTTDSAALVSVSSLSSPSGAAPAQGNEWFSDKRTRYIGWQTVAGYPLIATAGLDEQETMAPFQAARAAALRKARMNTVALAVFTLIVTALSILLAWKRHQLTSSQTAYRLATEGGNDGFYILRPIRSKSVDIVDFHIVDCNERGAAIYHRRKSDLIGTQLSVICSSAERKEVMGALYQALLTGSCERDLEVPASSPITAQWLYLSVVKTGGELAVTLRDITESKMHMAQLERRSNEDVLTGLPNRHWIHNYLPRAVEQASVDGRLALLFIDLDGFKVVNDTMGHSVGDELLQHVSRRLKIAIRPQDELVRIGGDEFVVIVENIKGKADAAHVARRIHDAFEDPFSLSKGKRRVGATIGISCFPEDGGTAETLLQNADIAMYAAKASAKGRYRFYEKDFFEKLIARQLKEAELRRAIELDQFIIYYQPRVDVCTGSVASMEALVRWAHPDVGIVFPSQFVALAEETGMILELGGQIIDKVCAQQSAWQVNGQPVVPVSINVSARQCQETDIVAIVSAALTRHNVEATLVELEITESMMMGEDERILEALSLIRKSGSKICIDDFGTGYSSLSQLQRLRFDVLKVDRAFIVDIGKTSQGNVFVNAIITMAHALGMRVVAEGVELDEQFRILKELRCDEVQGYYISKPLPSSEVAPFLLKGICIST
jgi:diguanylate cyclase (GGDEF)-like protein